MPWFKIEESFHQHPKVVAAGNCAVGLWVRCATYSAQYLTDGLIPAHIADNYGKPREIAALATARLWVQTDGGFLIPDYLEYQPSAAQVKQRRKDDAERKRNAPTSTSKRGANRDPFDD